MKVTPENAKEFAGNVMTKADVISFNRVRGTTYTDREQLLAEESDQSIAEFYLWTPKTKREIVCAQLDLNPATCSHGDRSYVSEFESMFGELTEESFRKHYDDADFTAWAIENGY